MIKFLAHLEHRYDKKERPNVRKDHYSTSIPQALHGVVCSRVYTSIYNIA